MWAFRAEQKNEFEITKNFEIFKEVYSEIYNHYVDEHEPGDLMKRGIDGMLESLDPYTNYIPESNIEDYKLMTTGQYGGVGALIKKMDEYVYISEPYENYPVHKAGIKAGDKILEVDGINLKGKNTEDVSKLLKGAAGSSIKVKIERDGKSFEKTLTREEIKIPDVPYYGMISGEIGYIKLTQFTQSASAEVAAAFTDLKSKGMKQLVFDLRGNGGGLLNEAVKIVNIFVDRDIKIVEQKGRVPEMNIIYKSPGEPLDTKIPMVVLVDNGSASASEIVSGALQDLDRAVIVGETSYGKGLVQQTRKMPYNSMVKLTVAKYLIPSGRCVQRLDYTTKAAGDRAQQVSDSLVRKFKTKNGRPVTDARGIEPDEPVSSATYSNLSASLVRDDVFFLFANEYVKKHEKINTASEFSLNDTDYQWFMDFANSRETKYKTATEIKFEEFKKTAERENYITGASAEIDALYNKVKADKKTDLVRFKKEITALLENEIVSRYYYQNGRVEAGLKDDAFIAKAREILGNEATYKAVLAGTAK
jgi:carboxyl-terminal processing protease